MEMVASPPKEAENVIEDLNLEKAAEVLETELRKILTRKDEEETLEVRPSLHFYPVGGRLDDSLEILVRDRMATVTRKAVSDAWKTGTVRSIALRMKERVSTKWPHRTEAWSRIQVLREEVNTLCKVLAAGLGWEELHEVHKRATDGFPTLFRETWQGKPSTAAHYYVIRRRLGREISGRIRSAAIVSIARENRKLLEEAMPPPPAIEDTPEEPGKKTNGTKIGMRFSRRASKERKAR